jgi:Tfp pilus assembly protein PilO
MGGIADRAAWVVRLWLARLGRPGTVGLALLVLAATLCALGVKGRFEEREALKSQLEQLRARYCLSQANPTTPKPGREGQLLSFYGIFPQPASLPDGLAAISASAKAVGLSLDQGEYRMVQEREARLARFQVTLPVKGTYAQIKGFIASVLREMPSCALEDIAFKRDATGNPVLDARIKFNLVSLRPASNFGFKLLVTIAGCKQGASRQQAGRKQTASTQQAGSKRAASRQKACNKLGSRQATSRQQAGSKQAASRQQAGSKQAASRARERYISIYMYICVYINAHIYVKYSPAARTVCMTPNHCT